MKILTTQEILELPLNDLLKYEAEMEAYEEAKKRQMIRLKKQEEEWNLKMMQ